MINILIPGKETKKYKTIYTKTCPECGCMFEFELDDCDSVIRPKCLEGKTSAMIDCPHCGYTFHMFDMDKVQSRKEEVVKSNFDNLLNNDIGQFYPKTVCEKCGSANVEVDLNKVLTSYPPQYSYTCKKCGHVGCTSGQKSYELFSDCTSCPNKPDKDNLTVGDTACTWCFKNTPYCTVYDIDNFDYSTTTTYTITCPDESYYTVKLDRTSDETVKIPKE